MLERVIENWLASVSERSFEIPFQQLLALDGYTVIHKAFPHGPMEQGKDLLAIDADGQPCAYQLKSGNLTLREWRNNIQGQIYDLLDVAIQHPSIPQTPTHRSYLVTTGCLDDTLRQTIDALNDGRRRQGKPVLNVIVKGQLQQKLESALGRFLPRQLSDPDMKQFLQLLLVDGKGLPDKEKVFSFLWERAATINTRVRVRECQQTCTEIVILGAYLAQPFQAQNNHVGEIEIWTLVTATLLWVSSLSASTRRAGRPSLGLAENAIWAAMKSLLKEVEERDFYVEGSPLSDVFVYEARMTLLVGMLSTAFLWSQWLNQSSTFLEALEKFNQNAKGRLFLWGEGAIPCFLAKGWAQDQMWASCEMEQLTFMMMHVICKFNSMKRLHITPEEKAATPAHLKNGLASPYESLENVLIKQFQSTNPESEPTYVGESYCLESLIALIVKRRLRQNLASIWYDVTYVSLETYRPEKRRNLWKWNNDDGLIESKFPDQPASWKKLREQVAEPDESLLPSLADEYPHILLLFTIVAPHRLNSAVVTLLEDVDWAAGKWILK